MNRKFVNFGLAFPKSTTGIKFARCYKTRAVSRLKFGRNVSSVPTVYLHTYATLDLDAIFTYEKGFNLCGIK